MSSSIKSVPGALIVNCVVTMSASKDSGHQSAILYKDIDTLGKLMMIEIDVDTPVLFTRYDLN